MVLVQDALAGTEAETSRIGVWSGFIVPGLQIVRRNLEEAVRPGSARVESQETASPFALHMQAVRNELQANLKQLIGIAHHFRQGGIQPSFHFNVSSLPLWLRQLDRRTRQGVEVHLGFGRWRLARETDEAGDEGFRAANVTADL